MKKIRLGLKFSDKEYGRALARALSCHYRNYIIDIIGDTGEKGIFYEQALSPEEVETKDYIVALPLLNKDNSNWDLILTDSGTEEKDVLYRIYKYQSVHSISQQIMGICLNERTDVSVDYARNSKIYCFASLGGGFGCSTISYYVAKSMALYEKKKILYLSLSMLCTSMHQSHKNVNAGEGFRRYLYEIRTKEGHEICHEKYIYKDENGLFLLKFEDDINYVKYLDFSELCGMIKRLTAVLSLDYIIVDMGSDISPTHLGIGCLADAICLIHKRKRDERRREAFLKLFNSEGGSVERIIDIINFTDEAYAGVAGDIIIENCLFDEECGFSGNVGIICSDIANKLLFTA